MKLSEFERLKMNDKRLKTDLSLIYRRLTKIGIVGIYPIG